MTTTIGVFSVGFDRYWPQFAGLRERLEGYREEFEAGLKRDGVEVVSAGLVDSASAARRAGELFASRQVELIFCDVTTYVPSATVLPVIQIAKAPVVVVGLQPTPGMNPASATTPDQLAHDNSTSMPEIVYALRRAGMPPVDVVFGMLHDDERAWQKIGAWAQAAKVARRLRRARLGFLGHAFEGMLDMNADPTAFNAQLGMSVEMVEMCDLKKCVDQVSDGQIAGMEARIREFFCFPPPGADAIAGPVSAEGLRWSARVAVALEQLIANYALDGLAYYYRGLGDYQEIVAGMIVGNSLLTARGIPIAGEGDLKNCVAMMTMHELGAGGSFAELHPAHLLDNYVFVGHDGPGHVAISNEKPALRGLSVYHGKFGRGVSVEFKVKNGPVTILGLTLNDLGRFKFVVAEGESIPGEIPATGNTNTRVRFAPDTATFVENWSKAGPTHHFALAVGHRLASIEKVAKLLGLDLDVVSRTETATK